MISLHIFDEKLKTAWRSYVLQSLLAVLALIVILYFLDILTQAAIVAALGASAFIIFAMPKSATAQPRNVIGGHIIGLIAGSICALAFIALPHPSAAVEKFFYIFTAALSVGLAIFLMAITDTEHPPAAGTALGIVAFGPTLAWSFGWPFWRLALFVLIFAIALSLARFLLRPWLKELV